MSHTLDNLTDIPHGTVDGYRAGCHGSAASCGGDVSCIAVFTRYQGDWGFRKRVDAGESPAAIIAAEDAELAAVRDRDKAANRRAKVEGARAAATQSAKRRNSAGVTSTAKITEQILDEVRRLAAEKKTIREIAVTLGVSVSTVTRARRAVGLRSQRMQVDRNEIVRLHGEGWNDTRIAEHFGVANSTISGIRRDELHLDRVRGTRRVVEGPRTRRRREITELHAKGATDGQIAKILGIPYIIARQSRARYGLPLNPEPSRKGQKRGGGTTNATAPVTVDEQAPDDAEAMDPSWHGTQQGYEAGCRGRGCPSTPSCTDAMLAHHRAQRHAAQAVKE